MTRRHTAAVVGSGPNGLSAAVILARAGVKVTVHEAGDTPGGACQSGQVLEKGVISDFGAAAHPFGIVSPVFRQLGLERHGLHWLHPEVVVAHPMDTGEAGLVYRSLDRTAEGLGRDGRAWSALHRGVVDRWEEVIASVLNPLIQFPDHPVAMATFGVRAVLPATATAAALFRNQRTRALFAGSATHSVLPPSHILTSAFGVLFGAAAQSTGWPMAEGGSQAIVDALIAELESHGGRVVTGHYVRDLREIGPADVIVLNLTPHQVLALEGLELSARYRKTLSRWRYGTAVHKVDLLLKGPIPWKDPRVALAGTVHLGGAMGDIVIAEKQARTGQLPDRPFVMVAQPSSIDPSRAPKGKTVAWAYAHVPYGCDDPATGERIMNQLERFAPGVRDHVVARHDTGPADLQAWNPNLVGGTIGGGALDGFQHVFRPALKIDPYSTGVPGVWLASSSTPPGGGVHGMSGFQAAIRALRELKSI